jgi:G3E family GTPase
MATSNPVRIALITGYLGAGKTTLLNNILANDKGIRAAVIVNDIGEVNIDADLIARGGVVSEVNDTLVPLTNGCICCTLADDLSRQLTSLAESGNFDHIIIEASGICEPIPIAFTIDNFCKQEAMRGVDIDLDNIIAVVDSKRMFDQFNGGRDLLEDDIDEEDIEALLIQQIEFCTTLVLNKADLVTEEQIAELRALVRGLQKDATIVVAENGQVDVNEVLSTDRFDFNEAYGSAACLEAMECLVSHD